MTTLQSDDIRTAPRSRVQRVRHPPAVRRVDVRNVLHASPHFVRVSLGGAQLEGFISASFDDHFKLMLPPDAQSPLILPAFGPNGPQWPDDMPRPVMRDFTPRFYDAVKRELVVEFALHGEGPATEWAARAAKGQSVGVGGPRGSLVIPMDYDWHVLIGDETALPAITRRLEELPRGARVFAVLLVADSADRRVFHTNAELTEKWVSDSDELIEAVGLLRLPIGEGFAWAAGEAKTIGAVRQILSTTHGMEKDHLRTAAYWKHGSVAHHENLEG
jgi:NADPH-dependent ferric siderophore reductase